MKHPLFLIALLVALMVTAADGQAPQGGRGGGRGPVPAGGGTGGGGRGPSHDLLVQHWLLISDF
jgi:hypothetical protein